MIPQALSDYLGTILPGAEPDWPVDLLETRSVAGGCIHNATYLRTEEGEYFLKWNKASEADNFAKEWRGLNLLGSCKTLKVPEPIATGTLDSHAFLLMNFIEEGPRSEGFWEDFGRKLATLHRNTQSSFGLTFNNYIGALPQSNEARDHWVDFFVEQRLEKQVKMAQDRKLADLKLIGNFQALYKKLPDLIPHEPPSLLHGDLWSGNFMSSKDFGAVLIDPAVYYGHREAEIAFTQLFGGFHPPFYQAYLEAWPLQAGWEDRVDLFNLYPLMVHLNLFGRSYMQQIQSILHRFV